MDMAPNQGIHTATDPDFNVPTKVYIMQVQSLIFLPGNSI